MRTESARACPLQFETPAVLARPSPAGRSLPEALCGLSPKERAEKTAGGHDTVGTLEL